MAGDVDRWRREPHVKQACLGGELLASGLRDEAAAGVQPVEEWWAFPNEDAATWPADD